MSLRPLVALAALAAASGCAPTTQTRTIVGPSRVVLVHRAERGELLRATARVEGEFLVGAVTVAGECIPRETKSVRIERTKSDPSNVAWGAVGVGTGVAGAGVGIGLLVHGTSLSPGQGQTCEPDPGSSTGQRCTDDRDRFIAASIAALVVSGILLVGGSIAINEGPQKTIDGGKPEEQTEDGPPGSCGAQKDLAGTEVSLVVLGLELRAPLDANGAFRIKLPSRAAGEADLRVARPSKPFELLVLPGTLLRRVDLGSARAP